MNRFYFVLTLLVMTTVAGAQRRVQTLGRGVVAVQNGTDVLVSWRKLAQEPENVTYNVYVSKSADGNYVRVNSAPLKVSNFKTTTTVVPMGSSVAVRVVSDLDGDGEMDYVVDRNPNGTGTHKIEAYLRDGTYLWTVDLGPNESISNGQDDQVVAYDLDCDGYDFSSGKAGELKELFLEPCGSGSFHQVRVADVDMDGRDEMIEGGWTMNHTGKVLFNAGIAHGDRFRTSDINPEIPGLETFAIQQNAGDMLGQILYTAENGEAIKKWYLSGVGDVGRGECYDLDPDHLGWEIFSTMNGYQIYDSNGDAIEGETGYFPTEALWWDGDLGREYMAATDGDGLGGEQLRFIY